MNGGKTLLDVSAVESFISNLNTKKDEIDTEYDKMKRAADDLANVAFKGDVVSKINEAMQIIETDKVQIQNIVTRFVDFLQDVKQRTIERDQEAARSISEASNNISQIKK
jgi:hypothetical protein